MVSPRDLSHLTPPSPLLSAHSASDSSLDRFDLAPQDAALGKLDLPPASCALGLHHTHHQPGPGAVDSVRLGHGSGEYLAGLAGRELLASLAGGDYFESLAGGKMGGRVMGAKGGGGVPLATRRCSSPPLDYCSTQARRGMVLTSGPPEWAHVSAQVSPGLAYQRHASQELKWRPPLLKLDDRGHGPLAWTLSAPCTLRNRDGQYTESDAVACRRLARQGTSGGLQVEQVVSKAGEKGPSRIPDVPFPSARATTEGFGPRLGGATSVPCLASESSPPGTGAQKEDGAQGVGCTDCRLEGDSQEDTEGSPLLAPTQEVASRHAALASNPSLRVGKSALRRQGSQGKRVRWRDSHGDLLVAVREFDIR